MQIVTSLCGVLRTCQASRGKVAKNSLDIQASSKPVKQRLRRFNEEKRRVIEKEIHKLLVAGFIKKVFHPEWLANSVLVKKKNGK
jgi:hypothetical protein